MLQTPTLVSRIIEMWHFKQPTMTERRQSREQKFCSHSFLCQNDSFNLLVKRKKALSSRGLNEDINDYSVQKRS